MAARANASFLGIATSPPPRASMLRLSSMREFEHNPMLLNTNQPGRNRPQSAWRIVFAIAAVVICAAVSSPRAWADDPNATVATVGGHKITAKDLDAKVKPQLDQMRSALEKRVDQLIADKSFDLKRQTLESMTDEYLIEQAAQHDKLGVQDYLKKEFTGKSSVTDAEAKAFYEKNKGQSTLQFDQIKPRLKEMMNRQALLERLRKNEPVKILLEPKRVALDSSGHPTLGAKDAPITIVEFTDFQCPFCKAT